MNNYQLTHLHIYGPFTFGLYGNGAHWFITEDFGNLVRVGVPAKFNYDYRLDFH